MGNNKKTSNGITLIALVVTIIVLLILAGISIQMLTGDNGILQRAGEAKEKTDEEQIIEEAKMDILSAQASKLTDNLTETELEGILSPKYGTLSTKEERTIEKKLTTKDGKVIPVSKIYNGLLSIPTIADKDEKEYYGNFIDYDVDLNGTTTDYDWKIFYNDGTNIYIIAKDYVKMDNSLMPEIPGRTENNSSPYSLYWPYNGGNIPIGKNGSADIFETGVPSKTLNFANKFLADWKPKVTGTNSASDYPNAKMTAILLDTNLWSYSSSTGKGFTNSTKIQSSSSNYSNDFFAIGGPTLEMWIKSWNKKHGLASEDENKLQLYYASNEMGYFLGTAANPDEVADKETTVGYFAYKSGTTGYTDPLYYPHTSVVENCWGYWLASPSAMSGFSVSQVAYTGTVIYDVCFNTAYYGIRPVVCLPSDITATWNETDGVWNIIKK